MIRRPGALTVLIVLVLAAAPAPAQQAAPASGASTKVLDLESQTKVLDLVFHVEDLSGNVQSLSGNVQNLSTKIQRMIGKTASIAVKESRTEVRIDLASDVLFDFDSAQIQPKARPTLARIAQFIGTSAKGRVRILGYTDGKGSATYNQALSERRAQSVEAWFTDKDGLHHVDFATLGFGARDPVAPNTKPDGSDNPSGRQKNRRVEIVIRK
jgi:outer membrane protein OmpA-like peptidoglycan-associated protein